MNLITFLIEKYSYKLISQNIAINLNINSSTQKSNIRNYKCPSIFNSSLSKSAQAWHLEYKLIFIQKVIPISVTWYIIYIHISIYGTSAGIKHEFNNYRPNCTLFKPIVI